MSENEELHKLVIQLNLENHGLHEENDRLLDELESVVRENQALKLNNEAVKKWSEFISRELNSVKLELTNANTMMQSERRAGKHWILMDLNDFVDERLRHFQEVGLTDWANGVWDVKVEIIKQLNCME
jgi:regulator of replication initiation timing